jgi:hypothetical protein
MGNDGSAFDAGIFLQGDENLVFAPAADQKTVISDAITDETGAKGRRGRRYRQGLALAQRPRHAGFERRR